MACAVLTRGSPAAFLIPYVPRNVRPTRIRTVLSLVTLEYVFATVQDAVRRTRFKNRRAVEVTGHELNAAARGTETQVAHRTEAKSGAARVLDDCVVRRTALDGDSVVVVLFLSGQPEVRDPRGRQRVPTLVDRVNVRESRGILTSNLEAKTLVISAVSTILSRWP